MAYPNVAVCLAAYNGIKWLEEQLDSILQQRSVSLTIFISVDASSDGTEDLVKRYVLSDSRVRSLSFGERFGSASQNFFRLMREVDFSSFDYVSLADQDDIWLPDKLIRAVSACSEYRVDVVSSNVTAFWDDGYEELVYKRAPIVCWNHLFESAGPGCTYLFKKNLAVEFSKFLIANKEKTNQIALHDWFLFSWARANSYKWYIDDYPSVQYRQHDSNEFGVNKGRKAIISRWNKLTRGWYREQVLGMAILTEQLNTPPMLRFNRFQWVDRIILSLSVRKFRRLWRDQFVLALAFLLMHR